MFLQFPVMAVHIRIRLFSLIKFLKIKLFIFLRKLFYNSGNPMQWMHLVVKFESKRYMLRSYERHIDSVHLITPYLKTHETYEQYVQNLLYIIKIVMHWMYLVVTVAKIMSLVGTVNVKVTLI